MKKKTFLYAIAILITIVLSGCGSASNTIRYGKQNERDQESKLDSKTANDDSLVYINDDEDELQDPSDLPTDESKIDLSEVLKKLEKNSTSSTSTLPSKKELMLMEIIKYLNTPYKYGGNSLNGIDCSAFTQNVYKTSWLLELNRSARDQFLQGKAIEDREDLKFGDLVFFNTRRRVKPGHVGIYIGENLFAHSSSKLGVTISSLEHDYYNKRYMGARRIDEDEGN